MALRPDYITVDEMRDQSRIDDLEDDAVLALAITTASRAVDDHCNRQFGKVDTPSARQFTAWYNPDAGAWQVDLFDLSSDTGLAVTVAGTTLTAPGYTLGPLNAEADGEPYTELTFTRLAEARPDCTEGDVEVTGEWGWPAVPEQVRQATLLQAARLVKRRDAPFGIAGSPSDGSELRLLAKIDPDVAVSLVGLMRQRTVG